ncbi:spidroin-1-like [Homarus americanus]|uniref:spidroin-1-like n=1 Tax=Homarus americanus TaxID=6706 RepID=UPI001C485121|nr:spidroin-1-like [Homarus americanus]
MLCHGGTCWGEGRCWGRRQVLAWRTQRAVAGQASVTRSCRTRRKPVNGAQALGLRQVLGTAAGVRCTGGQDDAGRTASDGGGKGLETAAGVTAQQCERHWWASDARQALKTAAGARRRRQTPGVRSMAGVTAGRRGAGVGAAMRQYGRRWGRRQASDGGRRCTGRRGGPEDAGHCGGPDGRSGVTAAAATAKPGIRGGRRDGGRSGRCQWQVRGRWWACWGRWVLGVGRCWGTVGVRRWWALGVDAGRRQGTVVARRADGGRCWGSSGRCWGRQVGVTAGRWEGGRRAGGQVAGAGVAAAGAGGRQQVLGAGGEKLGTAVGAGDGWQACQTAE